MGLEVVLVLQALAQDAVVVDLTVDGEGKGLVIVDEGLGTGVWKKQGEQCDFGGRGSLYKLELDIPTPTMLRRSCARTAENRH